MPASGLGEQTGSNGCGRAGARTAERVRGVRARVEQRDLQSAAYHPLPPPATRATALVATAATALVAARRDAGLETLASAALAAVLALARFGPPLAQHLCDHRLVLGGIERAGGVD